MGRHKRIPTKNRKKLKSVDPFNRNAPALRAAALSKVNWEPEDDDQPMSRSLKELQESKAEALINKKEVKKRKQHKNKVLAEAERAGIRKGRFETVEHFVKRVERMTYAAVKEHETLEKLKAKEERRLKRKAHEAADNDEEAEEEDDVEQTVHGGEDPVKHSTEGDDVEVKKKKRQMGHSDKIREKKRLAAEQARQEAALNQREIIPFGERYDAPPEFTGLMKKEMNPLMAKAGSKKLLLHSLLAKHDTKKTEYLKEEKKQKPAEIDRQRVIEAYRELKRKKAHRFSL
ncbi:hypothetical protein OESDEN_14684, partial [Oesophagostomum dentatum]